jgi:hypothetical protein
MECKGKFFYKMKNEYNLEKEYFLKRIIDIVNNVDHCSPVGTYVSENQQGRTSAKDLFAAIG